MKRDSELYGRTTVKNLHSHTCHENLNRKKTVTNREQTSETLINQERERKKEVKLKTEIKLKIYTAQ